ncbi:MAG: IclR family transcriptional regulator [Rubrivivax sp.]
MTAATADRYEVPALKRAEDILQAVVDGGHQPVRAAALQQSTGLSKSSLYLLLESLERKGWLERKGEGYVVGLRLFELGCAYLRHDGLRETFRAEAALFVAAHNEVVQLAVLDGAEVVYLAREDAKRPMRLMSDLGSRLPAHCCALGKALLASLDDEAVIALLPERLPPITDRSLTRRDSLLDELARVRGTGLAVDNEEVSAGLYCIGAYVGQTTLGRRVAISTSVPTDRIDAARRKQLSLAVVQLAQRLAQRIAR